LIRHTLETEFATGFRSLSKERQECRFVVPTVDLFEQEQPQQLRHLVPRGSRILVMRPEVNVFQRVLRNELSNRVVDVVFEPDSGDGSSV
jgi:hypothetical protein